MITHKTTHKKLRKRDRDRDGFKNISEWSVVDKSTILKYERARE